MAGGHVLGGIPKCGRMARYAEHHQNFTVRPFARPIFGHFHRDLQGAPRWVNNFTSLCQVLQTLYPPAQNQYMQDKILGELIFARIHAGPVFALPRIQENIFDEIFPEYSAKFLGEFARCEYMPRLYSHPREYRKIFLANYLCIGFVPGGIQSVKSPFLTLKVVTPLGAPPQAPLDIWNPPRK